MTRQRVDPKTRAMSRVGMETIEEERARRRAILNPSPRKKGAKVTGFKIPDSSA